MLKKWIEEIREKTDLYKTDSWKYHISGNVIEISILPAYLKDKKNYRCAVITAGQVLKALSCYIEKQKSNFHIQSFPTLENPAVVASIRIDETGEFRKNLDLSEIKFLGKSTSDLIIEKLAKQYQLDIQRVQQPDVLQINNLKSNEFKSWFALYSTFNNPFTWLNVGYWKESIQNICNDQLSTTEFEIFDFCHDENEAEKQDLQIPKNKYLQSIIGINTIVTTG